MRAGISRGGREVGKERCVQLERKTKSGVRRKEKRVRERGKVVSTR